MTFNYDIIVVGAGHAGCEAAAAAANLGSKTLLITMDMNKIAQMSCNPAVGGIAKGQIVREIDALGGQMGTVSDKTSIQFRMLNRSKGPAMWSPRVQSDRMKFMEEWRTIIENIPNLSVWQDSVKQLTFKNKCVTGVITQLGVTFSAKCVVLTTGTFMNGLMHIGEIKIGGGRISEPASHGITEQLREIGFITDRMKTGTPVRIDGRSVDFNLMEEQKNIKNMGGTMRLGAYECVLKQGSRVFNIYKKEHIQERHRHRYEFNNEFQQEFEKNGMMCVGRNPESDLVEIVEIPGLKWYVGTQYHPEYQSTVLKPHPLFMDFVKTAIENKK